MNNKSNTFWDRITKGNTLAGLVASLIVIFTYFSSKEVREFINSLISIATLSTLNKLLAIIILLLIIYLFFLKGNKRYKKSSNVLDLDYSRKIVILCQIPKSTEELRRTYDYWESQSRWVVVGGYNFKDYIRLLEDQEYLRHNPSDGTWEATKKAIEYIQKYHGY